MDHASAKHHQTTSILLEALLNANMGALIAIIQQMQTLAIIEIMQLRPVLILLQKTVQLQPFMVIITNWSTLMEPV